MARSYDGGSSKGRLYIHNKPMIKKRFCNQFTSNLPMSHDDRVSNPTSKRYGVLIHQPIRQLVECVERRIMVIASFGQTISSVVARVAIR